MQKLKLQKQTKKTADILIGGITNGHAAFVDVTEKEFFVALSHLKIAIEKDSRLKKSNKLETFYIEKNSLENNLEELRSYGMYTPLIGYIHYNQYSLHHSLQHNMDCSCLKDHHIEAIKKRLNIKAHTPIEIKRR